MGTRAGAIHGLLEGPGEKFWIQTRSGLKFDPFNPDPESIRIEDGAHALANLCRFTGHTSSFYSIAQHCVLAARVASPGSRGWALLHDLSEAYYQDIPKPLKQHPIFAPYREVEARLQGLIYRKFGLLGEEPTEVKEIDHRLLVTEARDLMSPLHPEWVLEVEPYEFQIEPWDWAYARGEFLREFEATFG